MNMKKGTVIAFISKHESDHNNNGVAGTRS